MPDPNAPRLPARRLAPLAGLLLLGAAPPALAQEVLQPLKDPPKAEIFRGTATAKTLFALPKDAPALADEAVLDLRVKYIEGEIANPSTGKPDKVKLRGFVGTGTSKDAPFVGPTIEIMPGETVRMTLHNDLPPDSTCEEAGGSANTPNCFNGTNMHAHGLWVNPAGNGDNVLISINPKVSFQYEYNVPPDHPAGTFWYHPHRHGSTALQVSSGMAGALIVRGNRQPTKDANGDLDVLLKPTKDQKFQERVLVFQQIQYACRDASGTILTNPDGTYACPAGSVGEINNYDLFAPGAWAKSGRYTSVNGRILPTIAETAVGQVERWRMVHAGVRDTISLEIRKFAGDTSALPTDLRSLTAVNNDAWIQKNCGGDPVEYVLVAADGLTTQQAIQTSIATLQPGYRWDALVTFPSEGRYCVLDTSAPPTATLSGSAPSRRLLGMADVKAGTAPIPEGGIIKAIADQLVAAAKVNITTDAQAQVVADLTYNRDRGKTDILLTKFIPHATITDKEVTGTQELVFNINVTQQGAAFFEVNGKPYAPGRMDRTLVLGAVDEWTLSSDFVGHPFHIHVNPFQIVSIESPKPKGGQRVALGKGSTVDNFTVDKTTNAVIRSDQPKDFDPQYNNLIGVWKDTLFVKSLLPSTVAEGQTAEDYKYVIKVRTRYQRYIGQFVLHCHILDHEDQGMMQNVQIVLPDGQGGASHGHH
ncbi:multicopper oxidase domain-containing protein [Aerophototrophica crusticola]|uniref:Multicopper oxidase domain-containing protein n=1 Tax=Aerophototrophica crusticola TaxID=1709002 RepID=A0A858R716_9PROT|nr:multicopper oxidase domain-containing protein [Rhodospirillaceae bacterium B3]